MRSDILSLLFALLLLGLHAPAEAQPNPTRGDLYVANQGLGEIVHVAAGSGTQTSITLGVNLANPSGMVFDSMGRLLVAERSGGGAVIAIDPLTGAQTVIASGQNLANPTDLTLDAQGNVLVVDSATQRGSVIRIDAASGAQTIVSSGGLFSRPNGVAVEGSGDILVVNFDAFLGGSGAVVRVDASTGTQTRVAAGGNLLDPVDVIVDLQGNILVAEANSFPGSSGGVVVVDPVTGAQTVLTSGNFLLEPTELALDEQGHVIVAEQGGSIVRIDPTTGSQALVTAGGLLTTPMGVAVFQGQAPRGTFHVHGTGLAGTGGLAPILRGIGTPMPGASIALDVIAGLGNAPGTLLMGSTSASLPFAGGTLHLLPLLHVDHTLSPLGTTSFPFSIPTFPGLSGVSVHFQAGYLDPGAVQSISLSAGLESVIG